MVCVLCGRWKRGEEKGEERVQLLLPLAAPGPRKLASESSQKTSITPGHRAGSALTFIVEALLLNNNRLTWAE